VFVFGNLERLLGVVVFLVERSNGLLFGLGRWAPLVALRKGGVESFQQVLHAPLLQLQRRHALCPRCFEASRFSNGCGCGYCCGSCFCYCC